MQRTVEKAFFALLRFAINGTEIGEDVKNLITADLLPALFKLAKRHDLVHLLGDALEKNGLFLENTDAKKRFLQERNMAVYRYEQMQYELEQICETLERAEIPFIPLKGSVIRQYYPEPWMRTSCDIDILVRAENLEQAKCSLQNALGYQVDEVESAHDLSLSAPSGVHLELHHGLAEGEQIKKANAILDKVWLYTKECDSFSKSLTDEMFYFYHVAHMAKHFEIGGCGVRPFLDVYLLKKHEEYYTKTARALLDEGGLLTFAKTVEETAEIWFGTAEETEISQEMQQYILHAGMYADIENRVAVQHVKQGGGIKYLWSRVFLPYEQLQVQYPSLRCKLLIPFYQIKRWFRLAFGKDAKNVARELKANVSVESDKKARVAKLLEQIGLQ